MQLSGGCLAELHRPGRAGLIATCREEQMLQSIARQFGLGCWMYGVLSERLWAIKLAVVSQVEVGDLCFLAASLVIPRQAHERPRLGANKVELQVSGRSQMALSQICDLSCRWCIHETGVRLGICVCVYVSVCMCMCVCVYIRWR
mmetsp:Transcript_30681/g.48098  ORF Transcript_30681/g.48098 Transcript_30681/m.48098 type:complete len:145 (+) Transcript_30681:618-1052(+)